MSRRGLSPGMWAYLVAIFAFLYVPLVIVVLLAFNDSTMTSFPFRGFTLKWFGVMANDRPMLEGLQNSVIVALFATALSLAFGTLAAYGIVFHRFRLRLLVALLIIVPAVLPKTVLGLAILSLTTEIGLGRSLGLVVFGHVLVCLPFVAIIVGSVMMRIEHRIPDAARDLGAAEGRTARLVILPLSMNGITAAGFIAFILSFSEFNLSFLLSGRDQTLPLVIFSQFRFEITPKINAISTVLVLFSIGSTVAAEALRNRRLRPKQALVAVEA